MAGNDLNQLGLQEAESELWGLHDDHEGLSIGYGEAVRRVVTTYLNRAQPMVGTLKELKKLPLGTVVLDDDDDLMQYLPDGEGGTCWLRLGDTTYRVGGTMCYGPNDVELPARVIRMGAL